MRKFQTVLDFARTEKIKISSVDWLIVKLKLIPQKVRNPNGGGPVRALSPEDQEKIIANLPLTLEDLNNE